MVSEGYISEITQGLENAVPFLGCCSFEDYIWLCLYMVRFWSFRLEE